MVALALIGLALDGNWPKVLRVALAAGAYGSSLWLLAHRTAPGREVPYWPFGLAGSLAGLVSGLVRPAFQIELVLAGMLGAALLIGGVHWLALRAVRRLLSRAES